MVVASDDYIFTPVTDADGEPKPTRLHHLSDLRFPFIPKIHQDHTKSGEVALTWGESGRLPSRPHGSGVNSKLARPPMSRKALLLSSARQDGGSFPEVLKAISRTEFHKWGICTERAKVFHCSKNSIRKSPLFAS